MAVMPVLSLAICLFYGLVYAFLGAAHSGITFNGDWVVTHVDPCESHPGWCEGNREGLEALRVGDQLVSVGDLTYEEHGDDRLVVLFSGYAPGDPVDITLGRDEERQTIRWRMPAITPANRAKHLYSLLFCLPFWLAGMAVFLFGRPRDTRWRLLVSVNCLTAAWLEVGVLSGLQVAGSSLVLHVLSWVMAPAYVHLHHLVPVPLPKRLPRWFMKPAYAVAGLLAVLELGQLLPRSAYLLGLFVAIGGSLGLLLSRVFAKSTVSARQAVRLMLVGVGAAFGPGVALWLIPTLLNAGGPGDLSNAIATLSIPVLPLFYTYAISKRYLGDMEFRANRLVGLYSFIMLYATVFVLVFQTLARWIGLDAGSAGFGLVVSTLFVVAAPWVWGRFQRLLDRLAYGTGHNPDQILRLYASRIAAGMDHAALSRLLADEVAPTLLIRQSSLCLLVNGQVTTVYERDVGSGASPSTVAQVGRLLDEAGRYRPPDVQPQSEFNWVRLAVPLRTRDSLVGVWLFGRRDPDDYYPQNDVALLNTLASQVAVAVENAHLYERAQQEIAERTRAEGLLRESEQKYRRVVDNATEAIVVIQDGRFVFANPRATEMMSVSPDQLTERLPADFVHAEDREAVLDHFERVVRGESSLSSYSFRITDQGNQAVWVEANAVQVLWEGTCATLSFLNDITERITLERQLRQAIKMESIGRLAGGVAHDFNNLLTAITGFAGLMQTELSDSDPLLEYVTHIQAASDRAASLTGQLLAFSRKQIIQPRAVDLNTVVREMEQILRRIIGEDIEMQVSLSPRLWSVRVDPSQMEQVIINLAVNGRDAMPMGGVLSIETENVILDADYADQRVGLQPGEHVKLAIRDNGVGMSEEVRAHVFEPFFTTKEEGKGTGLGLATVYGIVTQNGGHISCESETGTGTAFEIYLPRELEEAKGVMWRDSEARVPEGTETILLVEDEDSVRRLGTRVLRKAGYTILEAAHAEAALELAREHPEPIHLVVTDVVMPRMSGSALVQHLSSVHPEAKVLYMSGYTDDAIVHRGALEPGTSFIQKPFDPSSLAHKVREALESE